MAIIALPNTLSDGTVPAAADFMANFNAIVNEINGNLDNANIKSAAGIAVSKISGTAVNLITAQSISNKTTLKSMQTAVENADAATVTFDLSAGQVHKVTPAGNRVLAVSNVSTNQFFIVIITQDATGSRIPTWWGNIKWDNGGTPPTLSTAAGAVDIFSFFYDGTYYHGQIVGLNYQLPA